jgi:hypothetical protein
LKAGVVAMNGLVATSPLTPSLTLQLRVPPVVSLPSQT